MTKEIVILSRSLPLHGVGGMEIVAWDLARSFARNGHAVRIITTSLTNKNNDFSLEGVTIAPLQGTPSGRYSRAWWRESRRYFERHCMESTLAVLSVSAAGFGLLRLKSRLPHVPYIMQAHGTSWGEILSKWRSASIKSLLASARNLWWLPKDLLAYAQFDAVVAIGPRVYDDLRAFPAKYFLSTHKIRLINNGIDTSLFRPANEGRTQIRENFGVDERVPVVLSVSRLHRQKGVENVLKAFALLRRLRPESILLVAGDGPDRAHLEALTRELKQTDHVRFLGALDRNRLAEAYQISDVFAFLSEHVEGLPLNVLEALATGLPCVVSAHLRLFPSIFIHRFEYTDVSGVAGCLDRLLKAPHETNASELPPEYHLAEATQRYLKMFSSHDQQPR